MAGGGGGNGGRRIYVFERGSQQHQEDTVGPGSANFLPFLLFTLTTAPTTLFVSPPLCRWIMMAPAEVAAALSAIQPPHPLLPAVLDIWKRHAAGMASFQNTTDGRWSQVIDHPETFLETSVSAMTLHSLIQGVLTGVLDKATYDPVIRAAWRGTASAIGIDGTVYNISTGTGIGTTIQFYEERPTGYTVSAPGLGSVFRAAHSMWQYLQVE
jgi:rhamnogalacturonyl hydrolase YesR